MHIYYGSNNRNSPQYKRRVDEIKTIARYLSREARDSDSNKILVGDFNITQRGSDGFNALEKNGFTTVNNRVGSNRDQTKFYDQISFRPRKDELVLVQPQRDDRVFQYFDSVYRPEDYDTYKPVMQARLKTKLEKAKADLAAATSKAAKKKAETQIASLTAAGKTDTSLRAYYEDWRTFQMSDHLPLWVELQIDFADRYLEYLNTYKR